MQDQSFDSVRQAVKPVTAQDLDEALMLLRYDLHREMQDVIREQIRQFSIAKVNLCSEPRRQPTLTVDLRVPCARLCIS
jgi:hypothetical protein